MGEEEGVVIDVEREGQAAAGEGAGEEIEMGQEGLALVEPRQGQEPAVVVDDLKERQGLVTLGKPAVGRGIVLPELADLLHLPAAHGRRAGLELGVGSEALGQGPAPHGGAIELEREATFHFGSREAVGGGWAGAEQLAEDDEHLVRPGGAPVPAGMAWRKGALPPRGTGAQIVGIKNVEATAAQPELGPSFRWRNQLLAKPGEHITDKRRRMPAL